MIKKHITKLATLPALLALLLIPASVLTAANVFAETAQESVTQGVCKASGGVNCDTSQAEVKVDDTIRLVINLFSIVVGVVSVIMIIIGGFKYVISSGDSSNVTSAKNTILYAIIGLVVVALAQVIVRFVLERLG